MVARAMATEVLMPQLGESIAEGTIVRWNKAVGDTVDRDEPLFEISTDKVDAEIPSPAAGVLSEIRVPEGETVPIDSVVAVIGQAGETVPSSTAAAALPDVPRSTGPATPTRAETAGRGPREHASQVVRRLAQEHRLDLAAISGTGEGGRVTKGDVLRHVDLTSGGAARIEPLSVMRQRIAARMVASRRTSAHAHTVFDVDMDRVAELRAERRDEYAKQGAKLTYLAFIAQAVVAALRAEPIVNASLRDEHIVYGSEVNLGIAVALDGGLIVPVIRQADGKSVLELSLAIADLADRARDKQLKPDDVERGTFTITNPGAFGSIVGLPIINQPQVAILCVGAIEQRPVVLDDAVVARRRVYLTLGFDHRLIDGALADRFMARVKHGLEQFDSAAL
jgi:pyruvate dehydrogenase E2 component (dihydrolipoamide acetyltransferase)